MRFGTSALAGERHTQSVLTLAIAVRMVRYSAVLLWLISAGCASATLPQPHVAATQPAVPQPAATKPADTAVAGATPEPAATQPTVPQPAATKPASQPPAKPGARSAPQPRVSKPPAGKTPLPASPTRTAPVAPAAAPSRAAAAAPTLDLDLLEARLRATKAIGVFTKISLKNKVDDLLKQFTEHYRGKKPPLAELRLSYDLLMMKVLSLLQDRDQTLALEVVSSREAIWAILADEQKFAALQG